MARVERAFDPVSPAPARRESTYGEVVDARRCGRVVFPLFIPFERPSCLSSVTFPPMSPLFLRRGKAPRRVKTGKTTNLSAYLRPCPRVSHTRVISKLHTLAADPRNRPFIARDTGCLRNVIRTFDFPADDVVYKALETLSYLSTHSQENRQLLNQQPV